HTRALAGPRGDIHQTGALMQDSVMAGASADTDTMGGLGPTLRRLREARGLSPSEVTARLKFSNRQLDALENEEWDKLPSGISLRGFVKNYGRLLEADVDALLTMLDNQVGPTGPRAVPVSVSPRLAPSDLDSG